MAEIRASADRSQRVRLLAQLRDAVKADQDAVAKRLGELGGRVDEQYWIASACAIEIPRARLQELLAHPLVRSVVPDAWRPLAASALSSGSLIGRSGDQDNHNFQAVHLGQPPLTGVGAVVALFDTGVDLDQTGDLPLWQPNPDHHRAFRSANNPNMSRVLAHTQIGNIDCNSTTTLPRVDPQCPLLQPWYPQARHGTGVAAIAVGILDSPTSYFSMGHAPDAQLLSFSISQTPTWATSTSIVLDAIQALAQWILENPGLPEQGTLVDVLNISYAGWSDPQDITQLSLDLLSREFDILVVTAAGNEGDAAEFGHGFTNGLSVGNVHKYVSSTARFPQRYTSRGPLFGDPERYYPDVSASGAGHGTSLDPTLTQVVMPLIDYKHNPGGCRGTALGQNEYNAAGTSMSAPQVAGAAALYRGHLPLADAQETRAAILLATIDPLMESSGWGTAHSRATYVERNAVGSGYTRDDLLARFAQRLDNAFAQTVSLADTSPVTTTWTGVTGGSLCALAIAWPRVFPPEFDPAAGSGMGWANIDLEVLHGGIVIARSDSPRNTHERVTFRVPGSGTTSVDIRIRAVDGLVTGLIVPVSIAARTIQNDGSHVSQRTHPGFVTSIPQPAGCTHEVPDQRITRVVPSSYAQAYGSGPLFYNAPATSDATFQGLGVSTGGFQGMSLAYGAPRLFGQAVTIRGIGMRAWRGVSGCAAKLRVHELWVYKMTASYPPGDVSGLMWPFASTPPSSGHNPVQVIAGPKDIVLHQPMWSARSWNTFPIIIPFDPGQSFTIGASDHLGIWMRTSFVEGSCNYGVDWVADDNWPDYAMVVYSPQPPNDRLYKGHAPVLWLLEGESTPIGPKLDAYGFPQLGGTLLFQARQAGAGATVNLVVGAGYQEYQGLPCRLLVDNWTQLDSRTASTMGDATFFPIPIPNDPALLHQHLYFQAHISGSLILSDVLRVTFGGAVQ